MNKVSVYTEDSTVKIQAGATNEIIYNEVSKYGKYPFPGGTCSTVGVSGYASGGGIGLSSRYFGLGCDNVIELELVNYRGKIIKCNKLCNSDLFWACRGAGGGNFGVITSLTFKLPDKVDKICLIRFEWLTSPEVEAEFLDRWQKWLHNLDNLTIQTVWEDPKYARANKIWLGQRFRYVQRITNGSYVNFPYANLENYEVAYYGRYVRRLRQIKRKYDPCNVFRYPQSIKPI